ncbi:hypothetical protein BKA70DRAFT_1025321, partial [Coprinopsis sp. MPI-PUGE-AT-0042]
FYGEPGAYYGTVEQQGRLTLHLHCMLWIKGSWSPKQIRQGLLDNDGAFRKEMIAYLENTHKGEFQTGCYEDVKARLVEGQLKEGRSYCDPTLTLPQPPPSKKNASSTPDQSACNGCPSCGTDPSWWSIFRQVCDDLVFRSNVHVCRDKKDTGSGIDKQEPMTAAPKACRDKEGLCRARFPREVFPETVVDPEDGHVFMKKLESMINTYTPILTYLLRCNTDVTCLNSGTSMAAVIKYVTDYITKVALKSHHIFSAALDIYQK